MQGVTSKQHELNVGSRAAMEMQGNLPGKSS